MLDYNSCAFTRATENATALRLTPHRINGREEPDDRDEL